MNQTDKLQASIYLVKSAAQAPLGLEEEPSFKMNPFLNTMMSGVPFASETYRALSSPEGQRGAEFREAAADRFWALPKYAVGGSLLGTALGALAGRRMYRGKYLPDDAGALRRWGFGKLRPVSADDPLEMPKIPGHGDTMKWGDPKSWHPAVYINERLKHLGQAVDNTTVGGRQALRFAEGSTKTGLGSLIGGAVGTPAGALYGGLIGGPLDSANEFNRRYQ